MNCFRLDKILWSVKMHKNLNEEIIKNVKKELKKVLRKKGFKIFTVKQ